MSHEALLLRIPPRLKVIVTLALHPRRARIVVADDTLDVLVELAHRVIDLLEVADLEAGNGLGERGIRCVHGIIHFDGLVFGQGGCRLAGIADLTSVPACCLAHVAFKVALGRVDDAVDIDIHCCALSSLELLEIGFPDLQGLLVLERLIVEMQVDSRHERFVQDAGTVGGKKQDTSVLFKNTQEDWTGGQRSVD